MRPVAQAAGADGDRLEHRVDVRRGAADHPQDLGGGGLLLQGLGHLPVARLELLEQPRVLDGDRRLVGKGLQERDLPIGERPHLEPVGEEHTEQLAGAEHGDGEDGPERLHLSRAIRVLGVVLGVVDVDAAPLESRARRRATPSRGDGILLDEGLDLGGGVVGGHDAQQLPIVTEDEGSLGLAQADRVLGQRLEHRLEVERGPPDHLEQLAGRRLLLERDSEVVIARLQLLEQPHVLDGDHRLIGERLHHRDFPVRERAGPSVRPPAADAYGPDRVTVPQHGDGDVAPVAGGAGHLETGRRDLRVRFEVADVNDCPIKDRLRHDARPTRPCGVHAPEDLERRGREGVVVSGEMNELAVEPVDGRGDSVAQPHDALHDRIEDRLDIGRRAGDHAQDLTGRRLLLQRFWEARVLGLELAEQPRVLYDDGRLVGEGLHEGDLAVGERPDLESVDDGHPEQLVCPEHGNRQHGPHGVHLSRGVRVLGVGLRIVNVDGAQLEGGARHAAPAPRRDGIHLHECPELGGRVVAGHESQELAIEAEDERALGLAQADRVLRERLEYRLQVERGPPDHLEQLAGRRLLLERDAQVAVACLQLPEQAHVLDGDDGLIGEGFQKLDLAWRERARRRSRDVDHADGGALSHHGNRDHAAEAARPGGRGKHVLGVLEHIRDLDDLAVQDGPRGGAGAAGCHREGATQQLRPLRVEVVEGGDVDQLPVVGHHAGVHPVAQPPSARGDGVEHGLRVRGRAADDLEDLARGRQVAVARLQLREQPDVLDGNDRLLGEGPEQLHLLVREEPDGVSPHNDRPDGGALPEQWHRREASIGHRLGDTPLAIGRICRDVRDLGHGAAQDRATCGAVLGGRPRKGAAEGGEPLRAQVMRGGVVHLLAIEAQDEAELPVAELRGAPGERVEDGLDVGRRATDHAQDVAGRRLLLERLRDLGVGGCEGAVPLVQLREQARVLEGNHALVGERREERDLPLGERPGLVGQDHDGAEGLAIPQHRRRQSAPEARGPGGGADPVVQIGLDVRDVDDRAGEDGGRASRAAARGHRIEAPHRVDELGLGLSVGDQVDEFAVEAQDARVEGAAERHRARRDHVEDRLGIARGAGDDAKDLAGRRLLLVRLAQAAGERTLAGSGARRRRALAGRAFRSGPPGFRPPRHGSPPAFVTARTARRPATGYAKTLPWASCRMRG